MNAQALLTGSRLLTVAFLVVAFALRGAGLAAQELRGDEAFGYFFSLPTPERIVAQTLDLKEPHPVASYWLQHLWLGVAGHSEFALRFVGLWWSVLAVALMLALARVLALPRQSGIVAMALMALSPYAIWHAQDARMYSMSLALTMASALIAVRWWRSESRSQAFWHALCYIAVTWLALHTHYFALYVVVAQNIAIAGWAVAEGAWRKLTVWWGIGVALVLIWVPWLLVAWAILLNYHGNGDSPGLADAIVRAHRAFAVGEPGPHEWQWLWALSILTAMAFGVVVLWRRSNLAGRATLWFLAAYWLMPLALTWWSALNRPIFNERYLVAVVPPVYLLVAAAVGQPRRDFASPWWNWLRRTVIAVLFVAMAVGFTRHASDPFFSKSRGWRELAVALKQLAVGIEPLRVRFVQNYPDPTLWYYYQGDVPHLVVPPTAHDLSLAHAEVNRLIADDVRRVVLVELPAESWDGTGIAREALGAEYARAGIITVANWPLSIWLRPPRDLDGMQVEYEGGLQLTGAYVTPRTVPPGSMVEIHLRWRMNTANASEQEAVSVQLLNEAGQLVSQNDRPLEMASVATAQVASYAILLPTTLAAGEYQLAVIVYDPSGVDAPRRLTAQGVDSVELGHVTVINAKSSSTE